MHINLNKHEFYFASDQKPEEPPKEIKNYGTGKSVQASYLDEDNNHVLLLDFGGGTRFFVAIKDGMPGSFARVGDKFNITGFAANPTLISASEVTQIF